MFKPIVRASRSKKFWMREKAEAIATENGWIFTGLLESNQWAAYAAEFTSANFGEPFYGWAIIKAKIIAGFEAGFDDIDFAFGSDQMVFGGDYVITDEDYYDVIGAGE